MQMQPSAVPDSSSFLCLSHCVGHKGPSLLHGSLYNKHSWRSCRDLCMPHCSAVNDQCHSLIMHARQPLQPRQRQAAHCGVHTTGISKSPAHGARASTQVAAGNFMGLMGQILKDMSQTLPSGSSLTVSNLSYHPAGMQCAKLCPFFVHHLCTVACTSGI